MLTLEAASRALAGGLLIGLATAVLLLGSGRIAGVSGIVHRLSAGDLGPRGWRAGFIAGLLLAALLAATQGWGSSPTLVGGWPWALLAGAITGLGAGLANGCTSGHGVCGLSNLSPRSLAAVGVFMGTAAVTVFVLRHVAA